MLSIYPSLQARHAEKKKKSGFSEADAFRHLLRGRCLEDRTRRMLGATGRNAQIPKSRPSFLRSVPRKGNQERFGERQNSERGKTNSQLSREENHRRKSPWWGEFLSIRFQLRFKVRGGQTHSEHQARLGMSSSYSSPCVRCQGPARRQGGNRQVRGERTGLHLHIGITELVRPRTWTSSHIS